MRWLQRLWNTIRPGRVERDIERELSFHLAERADQLRHDGLSEADALCAARRQFGNPLLQAERTRDADVSLLLDAVLRDVRYALRSLARTPGFTITVVLTLALGIGANGAVFAALDAVLIRPLPFLDADRLMRLSQRQDRSAETNIAPVRLEEWHKYNDTFTAITGYFTEDVSDTSRDLPERIRRAFVTPRFLAVLGVEPALGRDFAPGEYRVGGPRAVLVSHRYWRDRLASSPNVLGTQVRVGDSPATIVGVMPPSFLFPDRQVDLWFAAPIDSRFMQLRKATWYHGIGRLQPGVTLEQARANLSAVQAQLAQEHPDPDAAIGAVIEPLKDTTVGGIRRSLWLLFGAVAVLLLIMCTNVAALLVARATHRRQELSVRVSLGASRLAVAAQVLIETLVLSTAGAVLGLPLAMTAVAVLRAAAADLPRVDEIAIDWRVVLFTFVSTLIVALLCGGLPAARAARDRTGGALKRGERTLVTTRYSLQWWLVGAQVALSVTLLAGAGLLVRSLQELWRADAGFEASRVLTFRVSGNWGETNRPDLVTARIDRTIEKLRTLPGVESAATTGWSLPGTPAKYQAAFELVEAKNDAARRIMAEGRSVSPEYFATLEIPVLAGEVCRRRVGPGGGAAAEIMVNRAFAARYLPGGRQTGVGMHLASGEAGSTPRRIAGIVGNAREQGLDREPGPVVYWCDSAPNPTPYFLVRTRAEPASVAQAVRLALKELEPVRAVFELAPLEGQIDAAFAQNRLRTVLLMFFAVTALLLASIGIYGTLSYAVNVRRREVGLRLALGAVPRGVVGQFLTEGLRVVVVSCVCGLALAIAFTRLLTGMLFGVSPTDPGTLAAVIAAVLVVATIAALVPAVRAARLDPIEVLRES